MKNNIIKVVLFSFIIVLLNNNIVYSRCTFNLFGVPKGAGCGNASNGEIGISPSGGRSPYTYLWSDGATTEDRANLLAGQYCVTVTDANGCSASYCTIVTGLPSPIANFLVSGNCINNVINFSNSSQISTGNLTYTWYFGNGDSSNLLNPSTVYSVSDTYNVTLIATSFQGCKDTIVKPIFIDYCSPSGCAFLDLNQNCSRDSNEVGLEDRTFIIQPGNIVVQTNSTGNWNIPFLFDGVYTITADTSSSNLWNLNCPPSLNFTINNTNQIFSAPCFGFSPKYPCSEPEVSIYAPTLRAGFPNQKIFVRACNRNTATRTIDSSYVVVKLDTFINFQSATLPHLPLGNNQYSFYLGQLAPNECKNFTINFQLDFNAIFQQTLCIEANLFPVEPCVTDSISKPIDSVSTCTLPWDKSSLKVEGYCIGDSVVFIISNTGDPINGDMKCFSPVRVYIDGIIYLLDSIKIAGGTTTTFTFLANGKTWRLEADQHPLHPGFSRPNATVELCGNSSNWTPSLVNVLPQDDLDPVVDIYCGIVTGSYDPNDKTGFPLGIGENNLIKPNQQIQYLIRFQNTGNDTAFTVVIRDTLSTDLDIFSVISGVSSHNYTFKIYGTRVLEWTFNNILLPDSNVNLEGSNGFVMFTVNQSPNLPQGRVIKNKAAIYFDFNPPIITNETNHTIDYFLDKLTSLENNTYQDFTIKLFPNPTSGNVNIFINKPEKTSSINIFNSIGQLVLNTEIKEMSNYISIQVNNLEKGIYILQYKTNNINKFSRLLIE